MGSEALLERLLGKFLEDRNLPALRAALEAGRRSRAVRAAHTLKGVCGNLSMTELYGLFTGRWTRCAGGIWTGPGRMMAEIAPAYEAVRAAIRGARMGGGERAAAGGRAAAADAAPPGRLLHVRPWPAGRVILLLRATLLRNAYETGTALSRSCAAEEQGDLNVYETLLTFGTSALEQRLEDGEDREEIVAFLEMYFQRVDTVLGDGVVDPYVVLDGEILSANPWEGDGAYDYAAAPWYRQAMAAGGEVVFTQVYTDAVYDRPVVTAAQSAGTATMVMAFDMLPEHLRFDTADLTEEDSFFLCDGAGTLIYQDRLELPREELQDYLTGLVEQIRAGELEENPSSGTCTASAGGSTTPGWTTAGTPSSRCPTARILGGLRGFSGRCC